MIDERYPSLFSGLGVLLGTVMLVELAAIVTSGGPLTPDAVITFLSGAPFVVLLVSGGYWLRRSDLSSEYYGRIARWVLVGAGFLVVVFGVIAFATQDSLLVRISILQWAVSVGAGTGLVIGVFESRAVQRTLAAERNRIRNEELQRRNERLNELSSVIAHDLRNPLNVANGYLELASEEHDDDRLEAAADALDRMERIIEETLTLARSGRVIDDTEPVDVPSVVDRSWDTVATQQATLETDELGTITADRNRLQQLLENLFRNAIEHGGAEVTVRVGTLPDGFYVEDDGPGIPQTERDEVFEAGYSAGDQGSGFGLAIVKRIAEAHGWDLALTHSDMGGARFEFTDVETIPTASATAAHTTDTSQA